MLVVLVNVVVLVVMAVTVTLAVTELETVVRIINKFVKIRYLQQESAYPIKEVVLLVL